jgi:2-polyprenyl-3-methyl-5-hydroxy-6-metoxy-1,4-benzoquinol methylase
LSTSSAVEICPFTGNASRFYCRKEHAEYYVDPVTDIIYQRKPPDGAKMMEFADQEYAGGAYKAHVAARALKLITAAHRMAAFEPFLGSGRKLLDLGCSAGFFLEAAQTRGFDVHGVEFSRQAVSMADPSVRDKITVSDIQTYLADSSTRFDIITGFDIIEHLGNPLLYIRPVARALNPSGLAVVATPDTGHFLRRLMGSRWPMIQPMQHPVLFSRRGLTQLWEQNGFEVLSVQTTRKTLTLDYLFNQLVELNPLIHRIYKLVSWMIPDAILKKPINVNIGEFILVARKK